MGGILPLANKKTGGQGTFFCPWWLAVCWCALCPLITYSSGAIWVQSLAPSGCHDSIRFLVRNEPLLINYLVHCKASISLFLSLCLSVHLSLFLSLSPYLFLSGHTLSCSVSRLHSVFNEPQWHHNQPRDEDSWMEPAPSALCIFMSLIIMYVLIQEERGLIKPRPPSLRAWPFSLTGWKEEGGKKTA